jgi:ubiquinone/menaquinone biosynthesis C-methylase UbiE
MASKQLLGEHAARAACTYGAAADHYGLAPLSFWNRYGSTTVSRLPLAAGDTVLDLCCGAGASAIPAARAVGPTGRVLGIDVAGPLLDMARAKAAREGLAQTEFHQGDATRTGLAGGSFDAVVCVFGVFFAPDMAAFVAEMWRLVRPGGVLAITTWGQGLWEPASTCFWESVRAVEPSLFRAFSPWDEITTPQALADLFARGVVAVVASPGQQHLDSPDQFWDVVLGTGPGHHRRAQPGTAHSGPPAAAQRAAIAQPHNHPNRRGPRHGQPAKVTVTHTPSPRRRARSRHIQACHRQIHASRPRPPAAFIPGAPRDVGSRKSS